MDSLRACQRQLRAWWTNSRQRRTPGGRLKLLNPPGCTFHSSTRHQSFRPKPSMRCGNRSSRENSPSIEPPERPSIRHGSNWFWRPIPVHVDSSLERVPTVRVVQTLGVATLLGSPVRCWTASTSALTYNRRRAPSKSLVHVRSESPRRKPENECRQHGLLRRSGGHRWESRLTRKYPEVCFAEHLPWDLVSAVRWTGPPTKGRFPAEDMTAFYESPGHCATSMEPLLRMKTTSTKPSHFDKE